ncbi:MAG TPA: hypothetical protein VEJ41_02295 [Candidatus Acidoferrales bacterium]|nr:hypothetical protein [Candidatus Acidoferrales bacterium]
MSRPLHIGISRLNRAIADYSLARLEFTIAYPEAPAPPLVPRVGGTQVAQPVASWAQTMKQVATLSRYVDDMRAANIALDRDPVFDRLVKAIRQVGMLAWNMESMHRRSGGSG